MLDFIPISSTSPWRPDAELSDSFSKLLSRLTCEMPHMRLDAEHTLEELLGTWRSQRVMGRTVLSGLTDGFVLGWKGFDPGDGVLLLALERNELPSELTLKKLCRSANRGLPCVCMPPIGFWRGRGGKRTPGVSAGTRN